MKSNFRVWFIALLGMFVFGITDAYAGGSIYSRARAFLKEGSPTAAGKVYVSTSSSTPSASSYKNCTSSTTAASSAQVEGASKTTTYHFWATANAGYKFTGWYSKNASGVYTLVSSNAHYSVGVTTGSAPSSGTEYVDKDLYAEFIKLVQLSFIVPTNGTYDISHKGAAVANYASFTVDGPVKLTAHPAAGYKLRGWYTSTNGGVTKKYFAFGNTCEPNNLTADATIGADFVLDDGKATFWPKGSSSVYDDLNAAVTATSDGGIIVVVSDGTLPAGNYTINKNITLLLPYSTTNAKMTEPNIVHVTAASSAPALSAYRKLSLAPGANITVASGASICLGGSIASVNGGNNSSFPCGPSGILDLSQGGEVTLNSGATLYAWGFVQGQNMDQGNNTSGVGRIIAKSGSTVWEDYQVGDWRGGSASSSIYNSRSSWKFFPFQSWTIQNIEAPIEFQKGANGKGFWTIFGDGQVFTVKFDYLASSGSLFTLNDAGSTLEKWYDPTTDKVCYQLGGGATTLDAMTLTAMGTTITTNDYNLPVPCNMSIILKSGTFTVSKPVVMHAGANMEVQSGATFNVNTSVYMFDLSEWGKYCMYYGGSDVYFQEFNTMTKHYTRGARTAKTNLTDAAIEVNGTMVVTGSGKLYSTASGCQVTGNNGGVVRFAGSLPSSTSIIMCSNLKNTNSVSMANVNLQNEDQTFTKSKGSSYFDNVNGRWFIRSAKNAKTDHTWDFTYIKSGAKNGTGGTDATVSAVYSNDKTGDVDRMKWFNVTADECDDWWVGPSSYLYNWTLNDAWHQFIPTGGGMYSGSDGVLHQKGDDCEWDVPDYPQEGCFYNVGGTLKALVGAELLEVEANSPDDHAWHKKGAASTYYICLPGCVWKSATRIAGYSQAYTTTRDSKQYIWYEDKWLEATEDAPFFCARIDNKLKYFEWNGSAWTLMEPVAEVTKKGTTAEYIRFSDVMNAIDSATANTTVRLLKNINLTSGVTYSGSQTCTFNLNGYTLSGAVTNLITISATGTFVVIDGSAGGTGKIDMTFAKADARSTAINITSGHLMLNSGTIHAENTDSATCAINVASGQKFTMNGGRIEAVSVHNTWGVHLTSDATPIPEMVVIKGGTIDVTASATTTALAYGIYSEGGLAKVDGGTIIANAPSCSGSSYGAFGIYLYKAKSRLTVNGGTIRGASNSYARSIYAYHSSSEATINGGVLEAIATGSTAQAIRVNGKVTINEGAIVRANSSSSARGIYTGNASSKVWVNGGKFYVTTSGNDACGLYSQVGKDTINGGEFYVTSKGTSAYGVFAYETASTVNICVADGKFMIKSKGTDSIQYAYCNNTTRNSTAVPAANISIRGGYWNINTNLSGYIDTKVVKGLDETLEADLIAAGYKYKVRGAERTVTWKNKGGAVLKTEKVEEGKVLVYTGATPEYINDYGTYEFDGWSATDGGALVSPLPAVGASDVTYFAHYKAVYAEVTAEGATTKYYNVSTAWEAALTHQQAIIKVMCSANNLLQLKDFNSTNVPNANSIITLDLNGYSWGMNGSKDADKSWLINVDKADSKLIITDNSESGDGRIHTGWTQNEGAYWERADNLRCVQVTAGELVLNGGSIKCNNGHATNNAIGVQVNSGATFTMLGGTVEAKKEGSSVTGGTASGMYVYGTAELAAGKIKATHSVNQAKGVYVFGGGVANIGADVEVNCNTNGHGVYGPGTVTIDGGKYDITTTGGTAYGFYPIRDASGTASYHISGNPIITIKAGGSGVSGVRLQTVSGYTAEGVTVEIDSATFNLETTTRNNGSMYGIYNVNNGEVIVHKATMNLTPYGGSVAALYAHHRSHTIIEDGTYTIVTKEDDTNNYWNMSAIRNIGDSAVMDVRGGHFTVTNNSKTKDEWPVVTMGGTTKFSGNTKIEGDYLFYIATSYQANGVTPEEVAEVIIDGGEYIAGKTMFNSRTAAQDGHPENTVRGDITVKDGYFDSPTGSGKLIATSQTPVANLKIYGGWFKANEDGKLSVYADPGNTTGYVREPSTVETLTSGAEYDAGYRYHVINKHAITWNDGTSDIRTDNVEHNAMPDYGGIPTHSGTDTYEFLGWKHGDDTVTIAKETLTYTAQWRKLEAEVYEGDSEEPIRYEKFTDAFNAAQNMHVARVKVLSDVSEATLWTLSPDSVGGSQPLTLDLNNHSVTCTKATTNTYALTINKEGCKLIIDDTSEQKKGSFNHSRSSKALGYKIHGVYLQNGELELAGGTLKAMNNDTTVTSGDGAYAVVAESGTVFTQTGGKLLAQCPLDPRAYFTSGSGVFNITGGTIEVTTQYKKKSGTYYGTAAYGVYLNNYGTFNMSGTATMSVTTGTGAYGVYVYGGGGSGYPVANMSGGSITCLTKTGQASRAIQVHGTHASANISGGNLTANSSENSERWNVEDVACTGGAEVTVTGGNFHSTTGASCIGVRVFNGTATIGGNAYFDSRHGVVAGDWAEADGITATATINGGTFNCSDYVLYANTTTTDGTKTVTGTINVNGGYFKTASGKTICGTTSGVGRLVLNGGYYNETSSTTQKANITTYKGGSATVQDIASTDPAYSDGYRYHISTPYTVTWEYGDVSESETVDGGTMPSKDLTTYTYGGKIYYVTGWTPALAVVTEDVTYTAVSAAYEAAVTVDETTTRYTSFADAWAYALTQEEATITLLNNINFTSQINYAPTVENGRHTLDLNNFTLSYTGTSSLFLKVNRADARLTITDNSVDKGGKLQHHTDYAGTSFAAYLYGGELVLAGGQLSVQNTTASKGAYGVMVNPGTSFTATGGTVHAKAKNSTKGISIKGGTAAISGDAVIDVVSNVYAYGIEANTAGSVTITGGTINDTTETINAYGLYVQSGASATISGGTIKSRTNKGLTNNTMVECFGSIVTGSGSALTITGGTFNINSADSLGGNVNIIRVQQDATATISGGTFHSDASTAIGLVSFGGVTTVSGTALFESKTGVSAGSWYSGDGVHDITATVNINGGTFNVTGSALYPQWNPKYGQSAPIVNSVITVNDGHFKTSGSTLISKEADGDGTATLIINGGYFNEKAGGTTFKTQVNTYKGDGKQIIDLDSDDAEYVAGYRYLVNDAPVAKVKTGSTVTYYTTVLEAMNYARTVVAPTITILEDAPLTARWYINPSKATIPDNWQGILDLNGHTVAGTVAEYGIIDVAKAGVKLTIRDSSVGETGKLTHVATQNKVWGVNVSHGELVLESGTIYVKNSEAGKDAVGVCTNVNEDAVFTMTGGKVETHSAANVKALYLYGGSTTISGGKVIAITELSGTLGAYAYGINMAKSGDGSTPSLTVSGADSIYAKAGSASGERAYALYVNTGTATIGGTPYFIAESPSQGARVLQSLGTSSVTVNGGTFESKAGSTDAYALIPEGSSTMTVNGGRFATNQSNIVYKATDATLTINGGYFNEYSSGTSHKTQINNRKGEGKIVYNIDADDPEYGAGYRYLVTATPVAKVKAGDVVTYYTTLPAALDYAKTQANPIVTMLDDVDLTARYTLTPTIANWNGTWDLNNYTVSGSGSTYEIFRLEKTDAHLTITDNSEDKGGTLSHIESITGSSAIWTINVQQGELILAGGTIHTEATDSKNTGTKEGVCLNTASSKLTMTGGKIETSGRLNVYGIMVNGGTLDMSEGIITLANDSSSSFGVFVQSNGTATISGGSITARTGANKPECFATYVTGSGSELTISGGTFDANSADNRSYNINLVRVQQNATATVSGGTFQSAATSGVGLNVFSGNLTVSGTTYVQAAAGITAASWYSGNGSSDVTATVTINGGTFVTTGSTVSANWEAKNGSTTPVASSVVTVNGGHFKSTGSNLIYQEPDGTGTASLTINGGYFNEKASGTDYKTQINNRKGSGKEVIVLDDDDDEYTAGYRYAIVSDATVARVNIDGAVTYHTTLADALSEAKTGDAEITILKDISGLTTKQEYKPNSTYTCTLDLNNHTISGALHSEGLIEINQSGAKLIIVDNGGEDGEINNTLAVASKIVYAVRVTDGSLELQSGKLTAKNTTAQARAVHVSNNQSFNMTGGYVYAESDQTTMGVITYGNTTISGGTVEAKANTKFAYGVENYRNTLTISEDAHIIAHAPMNAYGVYTIEDAPTASVQYTSTTNINGGTIDVYTTDTVNAYGAYVSDNGNLDGGNYYNSHGVLNITDGTFNVTSAQGFAFGVYVSRWTAMTNTRPNAIAAEFASEANISGGTFVVNSGSTTASTYTEGVRSYGITSITGGDFTVTSGWKYTYGVHIYAGTTHIESDGAGGKPEFTVRATANVYGAVAGDYANNKTGLTNSGTLIIDDGLFDVATSAKASSANQFVYGVYSLASVRDITESSDGYNASTYYVGRYLNTGTVTVNGGTFIADGYQNVFAMHINHVAPQDATTFAYNGGTVTIPAITTSSKMTINGGKFKATSAKANAAYAMNNEATAENLLVQGGYYNTNRMNASTIDTKYTAPTKDCNYYVFPTTEIDGYNYKVASGYTLTWSTDGDALTGTYTNGLTAEGTTIVAPNTPTKSGYAFAGWTPDVAATMPAENVTYTATWIPYVAEVSFNGGAATPYTSLAAAFTAAKANDKALITILQDISGIDAVMTYDVAKTCTLNLNNHTVEGTVNKLLTINNASASFTITDNSVAKGGKLSTVVDVNDTVSCLRIIAGTATMKNGKLYGQNTKAYNGTTAPKVAAATVYVSSGTTFVMDNGSVEGEATTFAFAIFGATSTTSSITINGGKIYGHTNTGNYAVGIYTLANGLTVNNADTIKAVAKGAYANGIWLSGGSATIHGGYIEAITDTVNGGSTQASGIRAQWKSPAPSSGYITIPSTSTVSVKAVARTGNAYALYLSGGTYNTIQAGTYVARTKTGNEAYGVYNQGVTTISGGTFDVQSAGIKAYGVLGTRSTTTISGTASFTVHAATNTAIGAAVSAVVGNQSTGAYYTGTVNVDGGTFTVSTGTGSDAYGAYATHVGHSNTSSGTLGNYAAAGTMTISGGIFDITAQTTNSYGVYCDGTRTQDSYAGGAAATASPKITINGGKFTMRSNSGENTSVYATNDAATNTNLLVEGGYYTTNKISSTQTLEDKYTEPTKSCNYFVFSPTELPAYAYMVSAPIVAEVSFNGGVATPYSSLTTAFTAAKGGDQALITILDDISGIATHFDYNVAKTCTLNLNNYTISGAVADGGIFRISNASAKFIITDNSEDKGGEIINSHTTASRIAYGVYVQAGELALHAGKISAVQTAYRARAIYVNTGTTFTMDGGKVYAEGTSHTAGILNYGNATLSGDSIIVKTTGQSAYGVNNYRTATINGAHVKVQASQYAYAVYTCGYTPTAEGVTYTATSNISGGTFDVKTTSAEGAYGVYITGDTRTIEGPTYYGSTGVANISGGTFNVTSKTNAAIGVLVNRVVFYTNTRPNAVVAQFKSEANISGGTFNVKTDDTSGTTYAEGIRSHGKTHISGGEFNVTSNTTHAYGINIYSDTVRVDAGSGSAPRFTVRAKTSNVYGAFVGEYANSKTGLEYQGTLIMDAGTIDAATVTKASSTNANVYALFVLAHVQKITKDDPTYFAGHYKGEGTAIINGGTFIADAHTNVYGINVNGATTEAAASYSYDGGTVDAPAVTAVAKATISGGKFKATSVASNSAYICNTGATAANFVVQGGYYNIDKNLATYIASGYAKKALTSAEKAVIGGDYNYQVTNEGGDSGPLDIVDYSATSVTLNMNGYTSVASKADWKVLAYGNTYTKTNRELDRTLVVDISSASLSADDTIRIDGTASDGTTVESHYLYIMPHIFTTKTTLDPASVKATSVLYVKSDTLTINADVRVNKVYVCADAMLVINSGKTLTVDTLILRTKPFHSAELLNNGTLAATKVYYTRQIANKSTYYEIALPFDVTLANVRFSNGKPATYGTHYGLMEYSGQSRADNGPNTSLNWQTLNPASVTTMSGKKAYEMISASAYYYEFYFPVTYSKRDDGATVAVTAYARAEGDTPKGDKGWNFITTPYTHAFECDYGENPEDGLKIAWRAEDNTSFNQDVATAIKPTQPFYYQTETTGSLVFNAEDFHFAAMPRRAAQRLSTQWIRLHYGAEGASSDVANIYLNDEKFTSAYETGYDVAKWSLDGGKPLIWTVVGDNKLAFAALPDSAAANSIPLTVFNPTEGAFTFSLEQNRYMKRLENVYLWDTYMNITVDLMTQDYTEFLEAGTIVGRFYLYTRNVQSVPTAIDLIGDGAEADNMKPRKVMIDGKVFIIRGAHVYSIDGHQVK